MEDSYASYVEKSTDLNLETYFPDTRERRSHGLRIDAWRYTAPFHSVLDMIHGALIAAQFSHCAEKRRSELSAEFRGDET